MSATDTAIKQSSITSSRLRGPTSAEDVAIVAQANEHRAGYTTEMHHHERAQVLYAISGVMRVRTDVGRWVVPPEQAVWIAPGVRHDVTCLNDVSMRSLY